MQTYKIYPQCTTLSTDKNNFLSARHTYFTTFCEVLTHPESKQKQLITLTLIDLVFQAYLNSDSMKHAKITLFIYIKLKKERFLKINF
jgi:hypothetical protein